MTHRLFALLALALTFAVCSSALADERKEVAKRADCVISVGDRVGATDLVLADCQWPIAASKIIPVIKDRLIDFLRLHISTVGGLTPARKLAALCEAFNVRTAWHGSADVSPVGHAANLMLDMNVWNFGIQEASCYLNTHETLKDVFPGVPEVRAGYMWPNGKPGLGVDLNEELAARFPAVDPGVREASRRPDGTVTRP